jgi:hypothetical protein
MASRAERIISWAAERGNAEAQAEVAERKRRRATRRERSAPRLAAKAGKRETKREARSEVRAAVVARADGRCERILGEPGNVMGRCNMPGVEMDHMHGRAREESVESCWLHCVLCARAKTTNKPSRAYWLWNFGIHAAMHGYAEQVAKAERLLALEKAQHPEHGRAA